MKKSMQVVVMTAALLMASLHAMASPEVDAMTEAEISEYAIRMSAILDKIQQRHLCLSEDMRCLRAEFSRHGVSYDDKDSLRERLAIRLGSIH